MDETRFDDLAKALGTQTTRRLTVSTLLGGTLGMLGLAQVGDARSGGCGQDCGPCKICKKGKCKNKNGKKRCKKGKCENQTEGTACSIPTSGTCQSGVCTCVNGTILTNGQCLAPCPLGQQRDPASSVCCQPSGAGPCTPLNNNSTCCSGFCQNTLTPPFSRCL